MARKTKIGFGVGLVLVGLILVLSGLVALFQAGNDGRYNLSDSVTIDESSRAVVSEDVELLRGEYGCYSDLSPIYLFFSNDDVRVRGVASGSNPLFIGIAPADAVAGYLDGVTHDEITDWNCDDIADVVYARNEGTTDPAAPGTMGFWVASVSGSGEQALDWTIESGEWALVIMNADGSPGVSADVRFGVKAPSGLVAIGWTSLVVGLVAFIGGARLVTSVPARPDETPRWTLRGRSILPTTTEGRVAVLCAVLLAVPYLGMAIVGALIFLVLGLRKGDRGLLLVLPLFVSIMLPMFIIIPVWQSLVG